VPRCRTAASRIVGDVDFPRHAASPVRYAGAGRVGPTTIAWLLATPCSPPAAGAVFPIRFWTVGLWWGPAFSPQLGAPASSGCAAVNPRLVLPRGRHPLPPFHILPARAGRAKDAAKRLPTGISENARDRLVAHTLETNEQMTWRCSSDNEARPAPDRAASSEAQH